MQVYHVRHFCDHKKNFSKFTLLSPPIYTSNSFCHSKKKKKEIAQSAGAVEYTDCFSAKE